MCVVDFVPPIDSIDVLDVASTADGLPEINNAVLFATATGALGGKNGLVYNAVPVVKRKFEILPLKLPVVLTSEPNHKPVP